MKKNKLSLLETLIKAVWQSQLILLLTTSSSWAFSITHDLVVHIGIFDASRTSFEYGLSDNDYYVKSTVKTNGFFNTVYPFEAIYSTTGKIKDKQLNATSYKYQSKSRFNRRSKELIYDKSGKPIYEISSKNNNEKKKTITQPKDANGTTDLQTVFAEMTKQYNKVKFCDSKMEVFDGKRRYNVIFKDEGKDTLEKSDHSPYFGTAAKCSIYVDKLLETGDDFLWQTTNEKPIYFWIMEQNNKPFIARIHVKETPLGALWAYTKKITIKD